MGGVVKHSYTLLMLLLTVLLSGCAQQGYSSFNYTEPQLRLLTNKKVVNLSVAQAWKELIAQLQKKECVVITNIDKKKRIITASFLKKVPQKYVDCGIVSRTTIRDDVLRRYRYSVAQSTSYILEGDASDWIEYKDKYIRNNTLSGTIKLHLSSLNKRQTSYVVSVRYVLETKQTHTTIKVQVGNPSARSNISSKRINYSEEFSTNNPINKKVQDGMDIIDMCCGSTGELERELLGLL